MMMPMDTINYKTLPEIKIMSQGGRIASFTMNEISRHIRAGITTLELDGIANRIIEARGAKPSFLNHEGFPNSICVSINKEVVHGIPARTKIRDGDIVKIDLGIFYKGFHTDIARTFAVGRVSRKIKNMILTCKNALDKAIHNVKPGNSIGDIEYVIGDTLKKGGLSPVMSLSGHGIGRILHEKPSIFCDGKKSTKEKLISGMVIAIEPMATTGNGMVERKDNGWTIISKDGALSFHFEDTVAVIKTGYKVLTRSNKPDKIFL